MLQKTKKDEYYEKFISLIKWASNRFSKGLTGRFDYWDFFEEGMVTLSLCLYKWKKKDSEFEDDIGLKKYFKTALFNRFRQIQNMSHSRKRFGINVPLGPLLTTNGFEEVEYEELVNYVKTFLSGLELKIFNILVDPPDRLLNMSIYQFQKKMRLALIESNVRGIRSVKINGCIFKYLNQNGVSINRSQYSKALRNVKHIVNSVVKK